MQGFLKPKKDRDMTKDIEKNLRDFGTCFLSKGDYLVKGINMPDGTSIVGVGNASRLILAEGEDAYTVKLGSFCTVKNLAISGAKEKTELSKTVGTRHGIVFIGNASETADYENQVQHSIVSDCFISSFNGGGITCHDTGYSVKSALTVTNCHISNCGAGINISMFSEYHKFTNVISTENLFGCVNNGGNNVFLNCGFDCNETGFLIDNSRKQSNNNSHGSAIGCTFNHSGNNKGIGIQVLGAKWGYVFSGCQIWYSKIVLENSRNVSFVGMNMGRNLEINVKGEDLALFSSCAFIEKPEFRLADGSNVQFVNCFDTAGAEINP